MEIKNDNQLFNLLFCKGIKKNDYSTYEKLFCAALETGDERIAKYLINKHIGKLWSDALLIVAKKFDIFILNNMIDALILADPHFNLEDFAVDCMKEITYPSRIKNIMLLLFGDYKVDPNGKNGMIFTTACASGNLTAVEYLIEVKKVDPNINDEMGFIFACRFSEYVLGKYLVEHGANFKAKNSLCLKILLSNVQKDGYDHCHRDWLINLFKEDQKDE